MKELKEFKKKFDIELKKFFNQEIKKIEKKDKITAQVLKQAQKITMSGGKRIRPALMYYGYLAYEKNLHAGLVKNILKTTMTVELVHVMLLIQDDIIDRDDHRHNVKNIHIKFGLEYTVTVGDIIYSWVNQIFLDSKFEKKILFQSMYKMQEVLINTVIGENRDVKVSLEKKANIEDIFKIYEYKTAKYTIEGPFQMGAILAGANKKELKKISDFAIPIGIAFQIQDDILGIFGSEKKIGKPVGSDIQEGKQTILTVYALKKGTQKQKKDLKKLLGKEDIKRKEINLFRKIIRDTGALNYAQKLALKNIEESKEKIQKIKMKKESKEFLLNIADYMLKRDV